MKPITNPTELRRVGLETLIREMGYVNAMRFMLQYETGHGDYTRERDQLLPDWSLDEMIREVDKLVPPESVS